MGTRFCALHISPRNWIDAVNNGFRTTYQKIVEFESSELEKRLDNILAYHDSKELLAKKLAKVYQKQIVPVEEEFVAYLTKQGFSHTPMGNTARIDIFDGRFNISKEEKQVMIANLFYSLNVSKKDVTDKLLEAALPDFIRDLKKQPNKASISELITYCNQYLSGKKPEIIEIENIIDPLPLMDYEDIEDVPYSCAQFSKGDLKMFTVFTIPLPMFYVNPTTETARVISKKWGVPETIKVKYGQPAMPTPDWLEALQIDLYDLAPILGMVSYDQFSESTQYLGAYVVKHSEYKSEKGTKSIQARLSSDPKEMFIASLRSKTPVRNITTNFTQIKTNQIKLFDYN